MVGDRGRMWEREILGPRLITFWVIFHSQQAVCTTGTCSMVMYDYGKMGVRPRSVPDDVDSADLFESFSEN